jgi:adenylyltransferase/sulfurtransferase
MDEQQQLRYSRQILVPEIGLEGQQRLARSCALLIGLGGLGSPLAMYLAAAGVGRLLLIDPDVVELSNLQRQIIHATADLDRLKVASAADRLRALNPQVQVEAIARRFYTESADELVARADIVVDGTDNAATRFVANAACLRQRKPFVFGGATRFDGQVSVFWPGQGDSPCYRCLYDDAGADQDTCARTGVVAPVLGIIGSIQALETVKILAGAGATLTGRLLCCDGLRQEWRTIAVRRNPRCPVCGSGAA